MPGRILAAFCAALTSLLLLTGCAENLLPPASEITAFEIVRVLGIDKSGGGVEVTVAAERAKPSPGEEGGGMAYETLSASGDTAFEALEKLRAKSDKRQSLGYVDFILFGSETAYEDFSKFADFPARSPEIRYSPKVFYVRGTSARELMETAGSPDVVLADAFDNLVKNAAFRSDYSVLRNIELLNMLGKRYSAAVIPAIELKESGEAKLEGGEEPEKRFVPAGYAVLRDNKLAGYFDTDDARAYMLLTTGARSRAYSIADGAGAYTGLELVSANVKIKPQFNGGKLDGVTYHVSAGANIAERQQYPAPDTPEELSVRLSDALEYELRSTIAKAQKLGADSLGLGEYLRIRHPYKWRKLESGWRESFESLAITVKAEAKVLRSYDIR